MTAMRPSFARGVATRLGRREYAPRVLADQARHLRLPDVLRFEARSIGVRWVGHSNPDAVSLDLLPNTNREHQHAFSVPLSTATQTS